MARTTRLISSVGEGGGGGTRPVSEGGGGGTLSGSGNHGGRTAVVCSGGGAGVPMPVPSAADTAAVLTEALAGTCAAAGDAVEVEELGAEAAAPADAVEVGQLEAGTAAEVAVDVVAAPGCAPSGWRAVIRATMRLAS
eukprot:1904144-Pleurochrysis_carterae.AAC.1